MRNGKGKQIFLDAWGDRLPPELLRLPKKGFGVPLAHWLRGSLHGFLWDHLQARRSSTAGSFHRCSSSTFSENTTAGAGITPTGSGCC